MQHFESEMVNRPFLQFLMAALPEFLRLVTAMLIVSEVTQSQMEVQYSLENGALW